MAKVFKDIGAAQKQISPELIAQTLGAEDIGVKIDARQGPISLFNLRRNLIERLHSGGGRPALAGKGTQRNKVPFLADDWTKLKILAKYLREKEKIKASPGQIASLLIHMNLTKILKEYDG